MKRIFILSAIFTLLFSFIIQDLTAQSVGSEKATKVAKHFFTSKFEVSEKLKTKGSITFQDKTPYVIEQDTLLFIFNLKAEGGFILVSGDESAYPIIAYSPSGQFPVELTHQSPALQQWMEQYITELRDIIKNNTPAEEKIQQQWEYYSVSHQTTANRSGVEPLLTSTWRQGQYYNAQCPEDPDGPDGHALVGCVATAMGQVMNYHQYPEQGTGSHSYYHNEYGTLSADFGSTTYDWSSVPGNATGYNDELAQINSHCGISVNMNYGPDGSGAYTSDVANALKVYFSYANTTQVKVKNNYNDQTWYDMLQEELNNGRPVVYRGRDFQQNAGHAFVCDGYDDSEEGYYHFNWGWGGYADGYFYLDNLNAGDYNWSDDQAGIMGIQPATQIPYPVENVVATEADNEASVSLTWDFPSAPVTELLQWDDGVNYTSIGTDDVFDFAVASRWYPEDLEEYDGLFLTEISFFPSEQQCEYSLRVWSGSDATLLIDQSLASENVMIGEWNTVELETPVEIDASQQFWFGYRADAQTGYPAGTDAGPANAGKGDMLYDPQAGWVVMSEAYGLDYNWNLMGILMSGEDTGSENKQVLAGNQQQSSTLRLKEDLKGSENDLKIHASDPNKNEASERIYSIDNIDVDSYRVYRFLAEDSANAQQWTPVADAITDTTYTDNDWSGLSAGTYQYAVKAVYGENESEPAFSNALEKDGVSHFTPAWEGNAFNPMIFMVSGAALDEIQLEVGDEIGIFDGELCVGAGTLDHTLDATNHEDYIQITAAKDDGSGNGYTEGNPVSYKVWDSSEELESGVSNVSFPYDPEYTFEHFSSLETNIVLLETQTTIDHQTTYQQGWNMASFAVEPEENNLQTILQPIIDNGELVKVIDEQGNIIEEMPWGWVNNIGAMSPTEGYYVKVTADNSITTTGAPVPLPYDILLTSGWNMTGYPSMTPQDATEALAELMDNNTLIKVIDEQGNIIENMPWGWVNNIGSFQAGEGYYIKVTEDVTLTLENETLNTVIFEETFDSNLGQWTDQNVEGEQEWYWNTFGIPEGSATMSGYNGEALDNENWLISVPIDLSAASNVTLSFYEAINYGTGDIDNEQEVYISTDYSGSGDPNANGTWTKLTVTGRANGDSWDFVEVDEVDLSDYDGNTSVYLAFKYTSNTEGAATWEVDSVLMEGFSAEVNGRLDGNSENSLPTGYQAPNAKHFTPVYQGNPYEPMQVVVDAESLDLDQGDELALYSNGKCVGAAGYNSVSPYQYLTASKDDPGTTVHDGYEEGSVITLKVYEKTTGKTYNLLTETIEGPSAFSPLTTLILEAKQLTTYISSANKHKLRLHQNHPNPLTDKTQISYYLPEAGKVTLSIYDLHGKQKAVVVSQTQQAGNHERTFDASQLSPGVYIYKLTYQNQQTQQSEILLKKMTVLR